MAARTESIEAVSEAKVNAASVGELERRLDVQRVDAEAVLEELDRRRHELTDWRLQIRRHGVAMVAIAVALIAGATGVVIELQGALDTVWKVEPKPNRGVWGLVRTRLLSVAMILSLGFLLLVSLVVSAALAALSGWIRAAFGNVAVLGWVIDAVVALGVITTMIALIYKILPDAKVSWRDVWVGAIATAILFMAGKYVIGLYIGKASVGSAFGAAGSLAVLLVWIYYSAQIVLLGAEFTRVYANRFGAKVRPAPHAMPARNVAASRVPAPEDRSPPPKPSPAHS